jgi:hypothetical protein
VEQVRRQSFLEKMAYAILVLNLLDGAFTMIWVLSGQAREANPLMAGVIQESPVVFMVAKLTLVSLGVLILWRHRVRRLAAAAILGVVVCYSVIVLQHLQHVRVLAELALR